MRMSTDLIGPFPSTITLSPGTDNINSAINQMPNGGLLHLKAGTYTITKAILMNVSNLILEGEGAGTIIQPSGFDPSLPDNAISMGLGLTSSVVGLSGVLKNCIVRNLAVQMNQTATLLSSATKENYGNCIEAMGTDHCIIEKVWTYNPYTHGIYFRATANGVTPSSPGNQPLTRNIVRDCITYNGFGTYFDAVNTYPNVLQGYGNRAEKCSAIQDWTAYNADVSALPQEGFLDWGNVGTIFEKCYAQGYTPNPASPSHTGFSGFGLEGAGSCLIKNCTTFNCYNGIHTNSHGGGGAIGAQIHGLDTYFTRFSIFLDAGSDDDIIGSDITGIDCADSINLLAGQVLLVTPNASNLKSVVFHNLRIIHDSNFNTLFGAITGSDALFQTSGSTMKSLRIYGGDATSAGQAPLFSTVPVYADVQNVRGYNPQAVSGTLTAGASPFTIPAKPYPYLYQLLAANGLTTSTLDGATIPNTVNLPILVYPGHTVVLTWATTAPTYKVLPL